jgi:hypothetical protein
VDRLGKAWFAMKRWRLDLLFALRFRSWHGPRLAHDHLTSSLDTVARSRRIARLKPPVKGLGSNRLPIVRLPLAGTRTQTALEPLACRQSPTLPVFGLERTVHFGPLIAT